MAQHARCVALEAGARGEQVHRLAALLVEAGQVKVDRARELLGDLGNGSLHSPVITEY